MTPNVVGAQNMLQYLSRHVRFCPVVKRIAAPTFTKFYVLRVESILFVDACARAREPKMKRNYFDPETVYVDSDKELDLIANRDKRAQWRHRRVGPSYIKMGRKVGYLGEDLNDWMNANRVEIPTTQCHSA